MVEAMVVVCLVSVGGLAQRVQAQPEPCTSQTTASLVMLLTSRGGIPPQALGRTLYAVAASGRCVGRLTWAGSDEALVVWGADEFAPGGAADGEPFFLFAPEPPDLDADALRAAWPSAEVLAAIPLNNGFVFRADSVLAPPAYRVYPMGPNVATGTEDLPDEGAPTLVAYPNPSAGAVRFRYTLPAGQAATLSVYDVLGRAVLQAQAVGAGSAPQEVVVDGGRLASGLYVVRLEIDSEPAAQAVWVRP